MKKRWKRLAVLMMAGAVIASSSPGQVAFAGNVTVQQQADKKASAPALYTLTESSTCNVSWFTGDKTEYTLTSAADLAGLAAIVNGYTDAEGTTQAANALSGITVKLGANVDMKDITTEMIGNSSSRKFKGTFDGAGYQISNYSLTYSDTYMRAGFFGYVENAVIKNVDLSGSINCTGSGTYAAGIVGMATSSQIIGCTFDGTVSGRSYMAGIAGALEKDSLVQDCHNKADLSNVNNYTAGIVASSSSSKVMNCVNDGAISYTGTSYYGGYAAGIVAYATGTTEALYCVNNGAINSAKKYAGGIIASGASSVWARGCLNTGTVAAVGTPTSGGGISGQNVNVESCVSTTDTIFGSATSSSYKSENNFCIGTATVRGVTNCTADTLNSDDTINTLNTNGTVAVWKKGAKTPEINQAVAISLYMLYDGKTRQYPSSYTNGKYVVELPADADLTSLSESNFVASTLSSKATLKFASDDKSSGAWKMTVTAGSDSATYDVQVNRVANAWTPEISTNVTTGSDIYNSSNISNVKTLSVAADIYDKGTLSYQWYVNTTKSTEGATLIADATSASYTPVLQENGKAKFGTYYYYVVITNTLNINGETKTSSVTSNLKEVKVQYTVSYKDSLVSSNNRTEYVDYGKLASPKTLSKPGYIFGGWYTSNTFEDNDKWDGTAALTDDVTVYAKWDAIHYTIKLPESTEQYTVEPVDSSIESVLYDGEYSFKVTPKNSDAYVLVKANGRRISGKDNVYKITDIQEDQTVTVEYTEGVKPDESGAYTISSEAELLSVLAQKPEKPVIKLAKDISVTSGMMNTTKDDAFEGTLDGQGHTISGLSASLFGWVGKDGVIKNLNISGKIDNEEYKVHYGDSVNSNGQGGVYMTCPDFIGGIAAISYGNISNCTSSISINSSKFQSAGGFGTNDVPGLGGIVGANFGNIENCAFSGAIQGKDGTYNGDSYGGIASSNSGVIRYCYNVGTVGGNCPGGIVGRANDYMTSEGYEQSTVESCYNAGKISGGGFVDGGAVAGMTRSLYDTLKNNYWLSGTFSYAFDGQGGSSTSVQKGRAEKMTADQMQSLTLVKALNQNSETSVYIKDTKNVNGGYPILIWQGTPEVTKENTKITFTGEAQAEKSLTAVVDTEKKYEIEWLLCDDDGFKVITEKNSEDEDIPVTDATLNITNDYVGKSLKVRVTSTEDGSSIVSDVMGPVKPAPIKEIYFQNKPEKLDLILDEDQPEDTLGKLNLQILADPAASISLLDGEKIEWTTDKEDIVKITADAETYDSTKEIPAQASVQALKCGTTTLTATIGSYKVSVPITVHPAYVTTTLRVGDAMGAEDTTVGATDLSTVFSDNEALKNAPKYATPLSLLTAYVQDNLNEVPSEYLTLDETGKVTAINGEAGEWICISDGKVIGNIDTSNEVTEGSDILFVNKSALDVQVDKIASFDQKEYEAIAEKEMQISLSAAPLAGGEQTALANADILVRKAGDEEYTKIGTTDENGKATLKFNEDGDYEITATHQTEDKTDILRPFATVSVEEKVPVTELVMSEEPQTLEVGDTYQLEATTEPSDATIPDIIYSSDNENVVTVDENGLVTAVGQGTAKVTATAKDNSEISKTVEITVRRSVSGISLAEKSATLTEGQKYQIKATVAPADATDSSLEYISNKKSVATVDEKGMITAGAEGETTIDVLAKDGSGVRETFTVKVLKKNIAVSKITLNAQKVSLKTGKTWQIKAMVAPANATNKNVTYRSSNTSVVTVNAKGQMKAVKAGKATVTVKSADGKATAKISVTVTNAAMKKGSKATVKGLVYVVTDSGNTPKVALTGSKDKKLKKVSVPETITVKNVKYKVTSVKANAFKNMTKNVTKIGKASFSGDKQLKTLTIKSKTLSCGSKAFAKTNGKITVKLPKGLSKKQKNTMIKNLKKAGIAKTAKFK